MIDKFHYEQQDDSVEHHHLTPLIDEASIKIAVEKLAKQIVSEYADRPLTVLGVLTGSIILLSDLIRKLDIPVRVGLIQASSYRGKTTTSGELKINSEMLIGIKGRDILLVDDIFDTGKTLQGVMQHIQKQSPFSVRSAVLLWKEGQSQVDIEPDYHCFHIPNKFVVGYGLDFNDEYRHLPYIAELNEGK
ncbi:Hypoxanthine-guanine phosphoribosyltransferase [hydrothermal vent metagenome]|uniref:hypoxanthine phosphoribosyltransferase n=1 Tax=hydrothermal vent metagenome TaxID=652676 RepID=A0A3B1DX61_9ZZZZ